MTPKLNIAVMAGGNSSEANISLKSAAQISGWLDSNRFNAYTILVKGNSWTLEHASLGSIPVDKNNFTVDINGELLQFHCALIAIHGTPGENGLLQAYFEMLQIPYTTGGVMNSSVTFNKYYCKELVRETGVNLAKGLLLRRGQKVDVQAILDTLGLPIFVKPNESGSSYGVSKVKQATDLMPAIEKAFAEDKTIILEEFIPGREFTCGVFKYQNGEMIMPVTEIVPEAEFFDYEAKYQNKSKEITPAPIPESLTSAIQQFTSKIYDRLQCRGVVRVDYIVNNDKIYFLEINTVPGMSEASIIPQQVKAMGGNMRQFFTLIINDALNRSRE
ncbi:D-alanine--D-alanine ligase [Tenuifilum osseticum]|uniref:D-alanine--D-alanine ligase n=1 Tax=Tenuifilum osseticum TaxID=3374723 RepID=UPI0034E4A6DD